MGRASPDSTPSALISRARRRGLGLCVWPEGADYGRRDGLAILGDLSPSTLPLWRRLRRQERGIIKLLRRNPSAGLSGDILENYLLMCTSFGRLDLTGVR